MDFFSNKIMTIKQKYWKVKDWFHEKLRIKRKFYLEPFIYLTENGNQAINEVTNRIQWLEKATISHYTENLAMKYWSYELFHKNEKLESATSIYYF